MSKVNKQIKAYFSKNNLPKPSVIRYIGRWANGECYAVTTGWIKLRKFCVYFNDYERIVSVRERT